VHQWFKNLLLFVPLLTAFSFQEIDKLLAITLAFFAFSLTASATYMGNDLWDLESDRSHPRKKYRPFASAQISIIKGVALAAGLLVLGLMLAANVSLNFFWMLLLYLMVTITYTWTLKTYVLIDVIVLSLLYTLRIIAGSVAVEVPTSSWLLAFSVFIFFSLALVKRCSELVSLQQSGKENTHGRDYCNSDLVVLWPLGVGSALSAVVVFGLFISAAETQVRYASPQGLWLVAIGLIYWLARLWIKTARGEMHDDPLVFAIRDFGSRITIIAMIMATLAAHFFTLE
jgi:4-hydroxybenzoate polyprenyltransferase